MALRFIVGCFNSIFCFDNDDGFIHQPSIRIQCLSYDTLIATMLRLALNLASTRLILANGHTGTDAAGQVIQAFGQFMMREIP